MVSERTETLSQGERNDIEQEREDEHAYVVPGTIETLMDFEVLHGGGERPDRASFYLIYTAKVEISTMQYVQWGREA